MTRNRNPERGAALAVTLMLVTALLAGGALAMYLQLADTHSAEYVSESRSALFCAEAGIAGARDYIANNNASWGAMLAGDPANYPAGYPVTGDLDGDGVADWQVTIRDNDDEWPTNNPAVDSDGVVYMDATCLEYPDTPREILELVSFTGGGTNYRNQSGQGAGGSNNNN